MASQIETSKKPVKTLNREKMDNDSMTHIIEQAYLIDRGTRPMTLLPQRVHDELPDKEIIDRLASLSASYPGAIPFVLRDSQKSVTQCGFASHRWVIDLFRWAQTVPEPYQDWIVGLLFGYSPAAIDDWLHRRAVIKFNCKSCESEPNSPHHVFDKGKISQTC